MYRIVWLFLVLVACQSSDTTPPTIASTIPAQGDSDIATSTKLAIVFSEAIKQDSLTVSATPNINLGSAVWNDAKTAVFSPAGGWQAGTSYSLSIEAKDLAGNALSGNKILGFKTLAPPDTTAPATPSGVKATAGEREFFVDWNAGGEGDLAGYNLYFGTAEDALGNTLFIEKPAVIAKVSGVENGTTYYYAVDAQDTSGNKSARSSVGSVTPKDTTAPTLVSSEPASGTQDITLVPNLRLVFSEPMNPAIEIGFCIGNDPPAAATCPNPSPANFGTPTWSENDTSVLFSPQNGNGFQSGKTYVLVLSAKDKAGNQLDTSKTIAFATRATPDTTPPTVANRAITIADPSAKITLFFSEPMNQQSVQAALLSQPPLTCTWTWQGDNATCSTAALEQSKTYTITLGTGAKDTAGNALAAPYQFSFNTPNFAPRVVKVSPTGGKFGLPVGVSPNSPIILTFSEAMNQTSVQDSFEVKVAGNAIPGRFEWDAAGTVMTYRPDKTYGFGSTVSWTLKTTAFEAGGRNALSLVAQVTGTFQTELLIGQ